MQFLQLVDTSDRVRRRGARLGKIEALSRLLQEVPPELLEPTVSMLAGELPYGRIGVGWKTLEKSLDTPSVVDAELGIEEVLTTFRRVAEASGKGSKQLKIDTVERLLSRATESEQDFLRRLLIGELRQGALAGVMLDAVSRTTEIPLARLQRAAMLAGDFATVAKVALTEGADALDRFRVEIFRPLQPMLAQPTPDLPTAVEQLSTPDSRPFVLEYKVDGARVQVHRREDEVKVYSRSLREVTSSVPEVVELALGLPCREVLLDGEAFAVTPDGEIQPFQITMRRFGRKLEIDTLRRDIPLHAFFFDCLQLDGEALIDLSTQQRWERLSTVIPEAHRIPRHLSRGEEDARAFFQRALDEGHEGLMAKSAGAPYVAGSRGSSWLKIKPTHTLDLVVLAAEWGSGRRRGKLSNLHLGARDPDGGFVMLGKTFKGLTDDLLEWQTARLLELETHREGHTVHVEPALVVEIAFNDIQVSPHYPGNLALRFARVKRYRSDKAAHQSDTIDQVRELYLAAQPSGASG